MDNSCREYLFVVDFFNLTTTNAQDFFDTILGKTLAYLMVSQQPGWSNQHLHYFLPLQKHVETYVESCYDAIGLFLCIHINYRFEAIMTRRGVPCLQE